MRLSSFEKDAGRERGHGRLAVDRSAEKKKGRQGRRRRVGSRVGNIGPKFLKLRSPPI
jgi:hypothetical protein